MPSTTTQFARTILLGILASITIPLVHAQVTYTYLGNRLGGKWEGGQITAKLTTDEIIPQDSTTPPDYRKALPCPKTWTFTIVVGNTVFDSQSAEHASCFYLGNAGNALLPSFLSLFIQQGDELTGTAVQICSHIHHRTYEFLPCSAYTLGIQPPIMRDPNLDWIGIYAPNPIGRLRVDPVLGSARAAPGTWSPPKTR